MPQITTPEGRAAAQTTSDAQQASGGNPLLTLTITQADTWIDNNVTTATLAVFKAALKIIAHLLIYLRDQQAKNTADIKSINNRLTKGGL